MLKLEIFKIVLEPPDRSLVGEDAPVEYVSDQTEVVAGPYNPGSTLNGSVKMVLREPMTIRGVQVCSEGVAKVYWCEEQTEIVNRGKHSYEKTIKNIYENTKTYFKWSHLLWGTETNVGRSATLPAGHHILPFQFELPSNIPSSFDGEKGFISYSVQASLITDEVWSSSHETKQIFTVIGVFDLNGETRALASYTQRMEDSLCCWCCAGGNYGIDLHFDRKGFVAGEAIKPVKCEIKNDTSSNCTLQIRLKIQTTYVAPEGQKKFGTSQKICTFQNIIPSETTVNLTEILKIPPETPPSKLTGCNFIINDYKLKFQLQPNGCNLDMIQFDTEIFIGTIPVNVGYTDPEQVANIPTPSFTHGNMAYFQYPSQTLGGQPSHPVVSQPSGQPLNNSKETHPLLPVSNKNYPHSTLDGASCSWMPDRPLPSAPFEVSQRAAVPQQAPPSYEECIAVKSLSGADSGVVEFISAYGTYQTSKTVDKDKNFV